MKFYNIAAKFSQEVTDLVGQLSFNGQVILWSAQR